MALGNDGHTLPAGWRWVKLADVCEFILDGTHGSPERITGGVPLLSAKNVYGSMLHFDIFDTVTNAEYDTFKRRVDIKEGDVLLTIVGSIGRCAVITEVKPFVLLRSVSVMRPRSSILSPKFLMRALESPSIQEVIKTKTKQGIQPGLYLGELKNIDIPLPPFPEQKHIAAILTEKMAAVEKARTAAEARLQAVKELPAAYLRDSYEKGGRTNRRLADCLVHISKGVGPTWADYPVLGATRAGLAPAKEGVGKTPERYKLVDEGTVFYNPMRILLGSIAMIDEGDEPGITSPDYVALKGRDGVVNSRWFYYWMRSPYGESFIKSMSRGAVRERMLFNRLAEGEVEFPSWQAQQEAADKMKHVRPIQTLIEEEINAINAMPALLLQRAFAGEL